MPRVSRTDVEFDVDGQTWVAKFVHAHTKDEKGILHFVGSKGIKVRHVTTCKLSHKGRPLFLVGQSLCSLKDEYRWTRGINQALNRALAKGGFCQAILDEKGHETGKFKALRAEYGQIMEAFYREMRNRVDAPVQQSLALVPVHGLGAVEQA